LQSAVTALFGPDRGRAFAVSLIPHDGVMIAHVSGELDLRTAPLLREHLRPLWERADLGAVVLDMAELEFCDSVGVGEIIAACTASWPGC
jgi:anti-anti-sigma factor